MEHKGSVGRWVARIGSCICRENSLHCGTYTVRCRTSVRREKRVVFMPKIAIRVPDDLSKQLQAEASKRGFDSPSAFVRHAVQSELRQGDSAVNHVRPPEGILTATRLRCSRSSLYRLCLPSSRRTSAVPVNPA